MREMDASKIVKNFSAYVTHEGESQFMNFDGLIFDVVGLVKIELGLTREEFMRNMARTYDSIEVLPEDRQ